MYAELKKLNLLDKCTVQSFDFNTLQAIHKIDKNLVTAALVESPEPGFEEDIKNLGYTPTIYSCDYVMVNEALMEATKKAGIKVVPWTINEVEDMKKMINLGVDGIITDYPNRARKLIDELKAAL